MKNLVFVVILMLIVLTIPSSSYGAGDFFLGFTDLGLAYEKLDLYGQYLGTFSLADPLGGKPITGRAWAVPVGKAIKIRLQNPMIPDPKKQDLICRYDENGTCFADTLPNTQIHCSPVLMGDWGKVTYHWYDNINGDHSHKKDFWFYTDRKAGTVHHIHLRVIDKKTNKTSNAYITIHNRIEKKLIETKIRPGPICRLSDIIQGPANISYSFSQDWANLVAAGASVSSSKLLPVGVEVSGQFNKSWGGSKIITISTPYPIPPEYATVVVTSMDRQEDVYRLYEYAWNGLQKTSIDIKVKPTGTPRTCFLFPYQKPEVIAAILKDVKK